MGAFVGAFVAAVGSAVTWGDATAAVQPIRQVTAPRTEAVELPAPAGLVWPTPPPPPPSPPQAPPVFAAAPATGIPATAGGPPPPPPAPRPPGIVIGSYQQTLINQDRAAAGLPPLTWSSCLAGVAGQQASRMAADGTITHTNGISEDLACGVGTYAGENLGYWTGGINDPQLNSMFMASSEHRANILGSFRYVGTRWVVASNGTAYLAVEFD